MSYIADVVSVAANLLLGAGGLQTNLDALTAAESVPALKISAGQVITHNMPADIAERSAGGAYPCVHVYCEKVTNQLREKFRTFSGRIDMAFEIRVSTDRVDALDHQINSMVDAVVSTLDQNRGDWGGGIFYAGAYDIAFTAVKHGGKNFIQTAKVMFSLEISRA
jgi:hypothetical protein